MHIKQLHKISVWHTHTGKTKREREQSETFHMASSKKRKINSKTKTFNHSCMYMYSDIPTSHAVPNQYFSYV